MSAKHLRSWLCAMAFAAAPGVEAAIHFYQLDGVVFDDGTQATGAFMYDDVSKHIVAWNVSVQGNGAFLPFSYMPGDSTGSLQPSPVSMVVFSSEEAGVPYEGGVVPRELRIIPSLPLGGGAGLIPIDMVGVGGWTSVECYNCFPERRIVAGALLAFSFSMLAVSEPLILAQQQADAPITKAIYNFLNRLGDGPFIASAMGVWGMALLAVTLIGASLVMGKKMGAIFRV